MRRHSGSRQNPCPLSAQQIPIPLIVGNGPHLSKRVRCIHEPEGELGIDHAVGPVVMVDADAGARAVGRGAPI